MAVKSGRLNHITVRAASLQVLIGGPYTDARGEVHTYGHTALRVTTDDKDRIYDFGRYGGERGPTGQGRMRVWSDFNRYIASQNSYNRTTRGFHYGIPHIQAEQVNSHFEQLISGRPVIKTFGQHMTEYRLANDYHALTNNCVIVTMAGARLVIPNLEHDIASHNQGRGMSFTERTAARLAGWPAHIFMPEDLQAMLSANTAKPAEKIDTYGASR